MRWRIAFGALVCFAIVNTAFLGLYLASGTTTSGVAESETTGYGPSGPSYSTSTTASATVTATVTGTGTATVSATSAANAATTVSSTTTQSTPPTSSLTSSQAQVTSLSTSASNGSTTQNIAFAAGAGSFSSLGGAVAGGLVAFFEDHSLLLAPGSWFFVGGMWIWRGRMRSKWTGLGFDSDVFTLFVKMKGAKTRIRLLDALSVPKDRLQLAEELGLDWKSVDRHVAIMKKYGFLDDKLAYGRVRMYQLTPVGLSLLQLLQELSKEERREASDSPLALEREG